MARTRRRTREVQRAAYLKWKDVPPGMPAALADEFMRRLIAGDTLSKLTSGRLMPALVTGNRFRKHCELNPEWAAEAKPLIRLNEQRAAVLRTKVNLELARERSAISRRTAEKCKNGHVRTMHNTFYVEYGGCLVRRCKDCNKNARENRLPTAERVRAAVASLHEGETLSTVGGSTYTSTVMRNFIRTNPKVGRRLLAISAKNASVRRSAAQRGRRIVAAAPLTRNNGEDAYEAVRLATADVSEDDRDDVMSRMFLAIAEGRLTLVEARSRVCEFVKDQRRRPRVYGDAHFSLDAPLGDDSNMTWLDAKTDADRLWASSD
jgi:hypothetical protein